MIGKLRGKVDAIGEAHCIIDVNGVGYEVQASARALRDMSIGSDVTLTIDTHVREDAIRLYGFASEVERNWFRTLQGVQGVEPQSPAKQRLIVQDVCLRSVPQVEFSDDEPFDVLQKQCAVHESSVSNPARRQQQQRPCSGRGIVVRRMAGDLTTSHVGWPRCRARHRPASGA